MLTVLTPPSALSGVPYLRKRSRSPWFRLPAPSAVSPLQGPHSTTAAWFSPPSFPPKPRGPLCGMAACLSSKSQRQYSSAAPFPSLPTISYTCQHSRIPPALLGCHSLGRPGPMARSHSSPSSHPGAVTRGSCLPVTSGLKSLPSPWLQARPQLFNISMKPVKGYRYVKWPCQGSAAPLLLYKTALKGSAPCVPSPLSDLWGWGHPIYIFLIFPGHLEFWSPLQIPIWGPPLGCILLHQGSLRLPAAGRLPICHFFFPSLLLPPTSSFSSKSSRARSRKQERCGVDEVPLPLLISPPALLPLGIVDK